MGSFLGDVRLGLRALIANPTFVVLAVLCLGIGIGASTLTFTVANNALIKPLGAVDAGGLVAIGVVRRSAPNDWWPASWDNLLDWRAATTERAELGALRGVSFVVGPSVSATRIDGAYATDNLFGVLGVAPRLGRALQAGDETSGSASVVVLSETYWRRELGGDASVVGRALDIDGRLHTIVGVVPALLDVGMPGVIRSARLWVPLPDSSQRSSRNERALLVIARLGPGVGVEGFAARLRGVANGLAPAGEEDDGWTVAVGPLGDSAIGRMRATLLLAMGAAVLVLLIACANLANLTLAHALRRRHEFAIRAALGASPWRLARQLFCESAVVATLGALLGLVLARFGLDVLVRYYEAETLAPAALPIGSMSLAFTIGATFVTAVLFGLLPALGIARGAPRAQLAESGTGTTAARASGVLRRSLIVGQVAASLVLLVGAALLSRSFLNLLSLDGGVETERVTSVRVESQGAATGPDAAIRYTERIVDALASLPGVETVGAANNLLPLRGGGRRSAADVPGASLDASVKPVVAYTGVTPSFFETLGVPLLRGRSLAVNERDARVAVVNERMAKLLWPDEDAVGRQFRLDADRERGWITVVGVAGDVLTWDSNGAEPLPTAYVDVASVAERPVFFFIRTRSAEQGVSPESVYRAIDALDLSIRRIVVVPMTQVARDPFWRQRLFSQSFTVFGVAAVVLTVAGIYGVLAHLVSQRGREIGIRVALGAGRRQVLLLVLREGVLFVCAGSAVGLGVAYWLARALRGVLFGVEPLGLSLYVVVAVFLFGVALAACMAPAARAARIDPKALLRG